MISATSCRSATPRGESVAIAAPYPPGIFSVTEPDLVGNYRHAR
jgi:hypothetical protein